MDERKLFKGENIILNSIKELPDDTACKAYLVKLKWHDGFICSRCGYTEGCEKAGYKYHCYACQYVERATANTLFHKVRFGLHKAFCIVLEMSATTKSLSSIQMGKRYGIRQSTAWFFMQKVGKAMQSGKTHGLSTFTHDQSLLKFKATLFHKALEKRVVKKSVSHKNKLSS